VPIRAVVFDVGETLVDETRAWGVWADHLGIPRLTFFAALGGVVERGGDHRDVFELFRPGLDLHAEVVRLGIEGQSDLLSLDDLYPDALGCLRALEAAGHRLAIAANQPAPAERVLREMAVPFEFIGTSSAWGVAKPDPRFFKRIVTSLDLPPAEIAYVGDRLDNDVIPARAAGMTAVLLRRGPWAWIQAGRTDPPEATIVVDDLVSLAEALVEAT
jgi:FMN phosphatase YigB (HAD superfamily)